MQVLTLTLPESSGKVQRILRRGPQECTNSVDRRERLSHVAAQGLAPLWGRRFRLPTYYFSAPKPKGAFASHARALHLSPRVALALVWGAFLVRGGYYCVQQPIWEGLDE